MKEICSLAWVLTNEENSQLVKKIHLPMQESSRLPNGTKPTAEELRWC